MKKTGSWVHNLRQRLRPLSLTLLMVASIATATLSPLLTHNAYAVDPGEILKRAQAWSILNAIIDERRLVDTNISTSDADTCHIFGVLDNGSVFVGSHVTGNNNGFGVGQFSGADWSQLELNSGAATAALASVGITGGCRGLLEKMGYTYVDGKLTQPGDFGDKLSERLRAALIPNAFFGANLGDDSPGDALAYAIMIYNLKNVCGWQYRNSFTDTTEPAAGRNREAASNGATGENKGSHYHTYTFEDGKAGDYTYYKDGGREDDVNVGSHSGFASSGNGAVTDCGDNNADTFAAKLADNHKFADAYAALVGADATSDNGAGTAAGGTKSDDKITCAIEAIGWLVCPVMQAASKIVDAAYIAVAALLTVQPLVSGGNSPIYQAWSAMRNFANIAFVIAFLVIVFSQLSSVGITNYGIKKMLPRLVVAAILVNVSFWVCAVAVDLSNIVGSSLNGLFHNIAQTSITLNDSSTLTGQTGWQDITGKILAGTGITIAILYMELSALVPAIIAGIIIIVVIFILLTIRQALIILLIVLSPLAFVAYLLPNTESLFKKWKDLLQTLLLLFPIIALLFGASALASKILMAAAGQ
ncbi:MAG TPA: hypothetical protein VK502_00145 [Candidatus Saccharimonadales bacterium]|nr:hypothetical protein [Candidatus Saccharimonadales bacterium]